jgi:hypothetical protein
VIELEDIAYVRCGVARQTFWQTLPDGTMSTRPDLMTPSSDLFLTRKFHGVQAGGSNPAKPGSSSVA